jgi:hypothetical protein
MTNSSPTRVSLVLRCFGALLLLVGAAGYLLPAPPVHWTALIPAGLGAVALLVSLAGRWPLAAAVGGAVTAVVALAGGGSALVRFAGRTWRVVVVGDSGEIRIDPA